MPYSKKPYLPVSPVDIIVSSFIAYLGSSCAKEAIILVSKAKSLFILAKIHLQIEVNFCFHLLILEE